MASIACYRYFGKVLRIRPQLSRMTFWSSWSKGKQDSDQAGAVRAAGDTFAKKEKAEEEFYFKKLQKEQLAQLKKDVNSEIKHHEEQIKHHEEALKRHRKRLTNMSKDD